MIRQTACVALILVCSGCSIYPYKERFACENLNDYGRCLDVKGAYAVATTGVMQGEPVKEADRQAHSEKKKEEPALATERGGEPDPGLSPHDRVQAQRYALLQQSVDDPQLPVVKQPQVVRTLILDYSDHTTEGSPLYGHRYVYFFGSDPEWAMSPYQKHKPPRLLPTIVK